MMAFTQERACVLPVPSQRTEEGSSTGEQGAPCGPSPVILQPCGAHASVHLPSCGRGLCWALATGCHHPVSHQRQSSRPRGELALSTASHRAHCGWHRRAGTRALSCGMWTVEQRALRGASWSPQTTAWTGSMGGVAGLSVCSTVRVKCTGGLGPLP